MTRHSLDAAALRLVRAIDVEGSVTAAARRLGITQPAASQQLRALERLLGTPAVVRRGRGVQLTDAGAVLARHAQGVESALDAAIEEVAAVASLRAGRVRLAAFPSASATILPAALARLRAAHPGLTITFTEAEPPQALALLDAGRCDIAMTFRSPHVPPAPGRHRVELVEDELVVIGAPPAGAAGAVALETLADEPWIAGCPQCRSQLLDSCRAAGFEPRIDYATDDYVTVLALVAAGLGVATLPGLALRATGALGVPAQRVVGPASRLVEAVTTPSLARVPAVRAALEALVAASHELVDGVLVDLPHPPRPAPDVRPGSVGGRVAPGATAAPAGPHLPRGGRDARTTA